MLPASLYYYRISPIGRLKASPFELLYGRKPRDFSCLEDPNNESNDVQLNQDDIIKHIDKIRIELQNTSKEQRRRETKPEQLENFEVNEFKIGDIVMRCRESFEKENKLDENWVGPYRVIKVYSRGGVVVSDMFGKEFKYNSDKLKLMEGTDPEEWEVFKEGGMLGYDDVNCLMINLI
jgi:hypothetical protein